MKRFVTRNALDSDVPHLNQNTISIRLRDHNAWVTQWSFSTSNSFWRTDEAAADALVISCRVDRVPYSFAVAARMSADNVRW